MNMYFMKMPGYKVKNQGLSDLMINLLNAD